MRAIVTAVLAAGLAAPVVWAEGPARVVNAGTPPPECTLHVTFDRNIDLPGYAGAGGCLPFTATNQLVPPGYAGDFYVDRFTDAAIRSRWAECKPTPACAEAARRGAKGFTAYEPRATGRVDPAGRIDPEGEVDLRSIRRPSYFGRAGLEEPIAAAEQRTYTVEFTVPRDPYERLHLDKQDPIKLRGWYLEGVGLAAGGAPVRALVVMNNGGGSELTALDAPRVPSVTFDPATQRWLLGKFPDGSTEQPGLRHWRGFAAALNAAGFDVLITDRRGNGISGGVMGFNTAEQARDMVRELQQAESGEGLRLLTPSGQVLSGPAAAGRLLAGQRAQQIPVVLAGYSRGSYATAWAMHRNFVADCDRELPDGACRPPLGWTNIKGAILYGPNSAGLGYRLAGHDMIEAALRTEASTTYYPDGEVLAHIGDWPGVLIVKGIWDYVEGLEGSLDAYRRAREPKEIFVFRGPHPLMTQDPENMRLVGQRMAAYAKAAVLGQQRVEGAQPPADLKALVLSSPDHWEQTMASRH